MKTREDKRTFIFYFLFFETALFGHILKINSTHPLFGA
jgi:hypothetical protein